ncbi:glycoside hydrolase superfamily [Microdochium bolleyi]|uniref:cellulase n=1 Tax=Microdochium bolleyi TaxID=196109 RepID=A0A136IZP0_9PEZI|nr:glycoside hydrolase superfamily [Microdochium bolleyi]
MHKSLPFLALAGYASAQSGAWQQCGGENYSGSKTCVSGHTCVVVNQYYHQCQPGGTGGGGGGDNGGGNGGGGGTGKFTFLGTNEAGAEFAYEAWPGVEGKDFTFPLLSSIAVLKAQGYNTFRVPFLMERLSPASVSGAFSAPYLANLTAVINGITNAGSYAVLDPHNYGRYRKEIITDTAAFGTFWRNLATQFKSNPKVVFDTNNEYHDMDQTLVFNLNQAAITNIRAAGATSQYIFAEGNSWSGAWHWAEVNDNLKNLKDPNNKLVYEMHQYLDSDGSGTSTACVSNTVGAERLSTATAWLRNNKKVGVIGEFAGGANEGCKAAVKSLLDHAKTNSDVWLGAIWWAAGPWWGDYIYNFEPEAGVGYKYYNSLLKSYA